MNLQQLEYILAVNEHRHFVRAAESCFVSQATLSMMIKKLEEEFHVIIFDRSKQPVVPTEIGKKMIEQARTIISETHKMRDLVQEEKGELQGELRLGIIPTVAPYLMPLFLDNFVKSYPKVKLFIREHTTETLLSKMRSGLLDAGILATPLTNSGAWKEQSLYFERYMLYVGPQELGYPKQYVLPSAIKIDRLWLLEEGHCMRNQVINLCELKKKHEGVEQVHYEAGSIETLKNLVEKNYGITVIPELATLNMSAQQQKQLRAFKAPVPVREISLVTEREHVKKRMIDALFICIQQHLPPSLSGVSGKKNVLSIRAKND
jgi:LysR family transcriptional regulator, hydrogen peroxide-inducible genes activator